MKVHGRELTPDEITDEMRSFGRVRTAVELHVAQQQQEMKRIGTLLREHPDGKLLLETLMDLYYNGTMRAEKPEDTYFNLGQREVVVFLLDLRNKEK